MARAVGSPVPVRLLRCPTMSNRETLAPGEYLTTMRRNVEPARSSPDRTSGGSASWETIAGTGPLPRTIQEVGYLPPAANPLRAPNFVRYAVAPRFAWRKPRSASRPSSRPAITIA
jgi:hypothetical protein